MEVTIKFGKISHKLQFSEDTTVAQLKVEVAKLVNINPENQKIICRGKTLAESSKKLTEYNVQNGSNLVLLSSAKKVSETKTSTASSSQSRPPVPDKSIVDLGPPPGALQNFQTTVTVMPKEPFVVRTNKGIANLQFETNGLFVQYKDKKDDGSEPESERIFASDIKTYSNEQNPNNKKDYFHLCLRTSDGERIFYFLPNQYLRKISQIIESWKMSGY